MKNKIIILSALITILSFTSAKAFDLTMDGKTVPYEGPNVNLVLNGTKFEAQANQMPPVIVESRTLVPVREVFELLGGSVSWDGNTRTVTISKDTTEVNLVIDSLSAKVNGVDTSLDVPAKIINDKTMVPVRFISENCGLNVDWNGETSTVTISTPQQVLEPAPANTIETEPKEISFAAKSFNEKYTRYFGEKKSKTVAYQLTDLATSNNAANPDSPMTVTLIDEKEQTISADTVASIHDITSNILKFDKAFYDISGEYNEAGFLNKLILKRIPW
jgi:hypothetical protein